MFEGGVLQMWTIIPISLGVAYSSKIKTPAQTPLVQISYTLKLPDWVSYSYDSG